MFLLKIIVYSFTLITTISTNVCRFHLEDLPKKPIIVTMTRYPRLLAPYMEAGIIEIPSSSFIGLKCTNSNFTIAPQLSYIEAKCIKNDIFETQVTGQISLRQLECEKISIGYVINNPVPCTNHGQLMRTVFEIPEIDFELTNYRMCYDKQTKLVLYSYYCFSNFHFGSHLLNVPQNYRVLFKISSKKLYRQQNIMNAFERTLGSNEMAKMYLSDDAHDIVPFHLTTQDMFMFEIKQTKAIADFNSIPTWEIIRSKISPTWIQYEYALQKDSKGSYHVATGIYDVLSLYDVNGNLQTMYFTREKEIPIPKYIWKMFYNWRKRSGLVSIIINNPFQADFNPGDIFCKNVCKNEQTKDFVQLPEGILGFCCEMHDFLNATKYENMFSYNL